MEIKVNVKMDGYENLWEEKTILISNEEIEKLVDRYFDMRMEQVKNEPRFIHHD